MTSSSAPERHFFAELGSLKDHLLWIVSVVERAHDPERSEKKEFAQGDATVLSACKDVRSVILKNWTQEREAAVLEREKQRVGAFRNEALLLLGPERFAKTMTLAEDARDNIVESVKIIKAAAMTLENSPDFEEYKARMRISAARAAALPNVLTLSERAKTAAKDFSETQKQEEKSSLGKALRGETSVSNLLEEGILKMAEKLGASKTKLANEPNAEAFQALVRFRNSEGPAKSLAAILLRVDGAAPVLVDKSYQLLSYLRREGEAERQAKWLFKKHLELVSQARLDELVAYFSRVDPSILDQSDKTKKSFWNDPLTTIKSGAVHAALRALQKFSFPSFEGEKDQTKYKITNIVMSHFGVEDKNVKLMWNSTLGQIKRGDPVLKVVIDDLNADVTGMNFDIRRPFFPVVAGTCDAQVKGVSIVMGIQLVRRSRKHAIAVATKILSDFSASTGPSTPVSESTPSPSNNAGSNNPFDDADSSDDQQVPQLVLGISRVQIDNVRLVVKEQGFYSFVADMFGDTIRQYLTALFEDEMVRVISEHLERFNLHLARDVWDVLDAALEVDVHQLPTEEEAAARAEALDKPIMSMPNVYSVTFKGEGSLGIVLAKYHEFVVVKGFRRDKNDRMLPGEASGKIKVNDVLVGFNGAEITSLPLDHVTTRLAKSRRPLTLYFAPPQAAGLDEASKISNVQTFKFTEDKLLLLIKQRSAPSEDRGAVVTGFRPPTDGTPEGPAQKAKVPVGWILAGINSESMLKKTFKDTMAAFVAASRPVTLKFVRDPDYAVTVTEKPFDLRVTTSPNAKAVIVAGFDRQPSPACVALEDKLESGDQLTTVGATDVSFTKFDDIINKLRVEPRPLVIAFSRNGAEVARFSAPAGPLGISFYKSSADGKCCFKGFQGLEGPVERTKLVQPGHRLMEVAGIRIESEEHARTTLAAVSAAGCELRFRDGDAFLEGGW